MDNIKKFYKYKIKYENLVSQLGSADNLTKQLIILTVPHSKCIENLNVHVCDFGALKCAKIISEKLSGDQNETIILEANINRTILDLNRIKSFNSDYRTKLRSTVIDKIKENEKLDIKNKNRIIYIIDCHSFPDKTNDFSNVRIKNPDVAILMASCYQLNYAEEMTDILHELGISATKHLGNGNDIIEEFYSVNQKLKFGYNTIIIPLLLEFNEGLSDNKIKIIGTGIGEWIESINKFSNEVA